MISSSICWNHSWPWRTDLFFPLQLLHFFFFFYRARACQLDRCYPETHFPSSPFFCLFLLPLHRCCFLCLSSLSLSLFICAERNDLNTKVVCSSMLSLLSTKSSVLFYIYIFPWQPSPSSCSFKFYALRIFF